MKTLWEVLTTQQFSSRFENINIMVRVWKKTLLKFIYKKIFQLFTVLSYAGTNKGFLKKTLFKML